MTAQEHSGVAARNSVRFPLRLPNNGMRERLAEQARRNQRAVNSEIIAQLESVEFMQQELDRLRRLVDAGFGPQAFPEKKNVQ